MCAQYAISAAVMTITVAASADTMKLAVTMAGADTGGGGAAVRPDEACATRAALRGRRTPQRNLCA